MNRLRFLPPANSPSAPRDVAVAAAQALRDPFDTAQRLLQRRYSAQAALLCGSGTQALQVALSIASERIRSTRVAIPAYTCFDVASAVVGWGGQAFLYDIDPATLTPDPSSLEHALRNGAGIVVVAPLYGYPCDFEELASLAQAYGALLVEDAAQAHGMSWRGRIAGSLGNISVLSFGKGKGWTGGGGGAVLLRTGRADVEMRPASGASELRAFALAAAAALLSHPRVYGLPRSVPFLELGRTVFHDPQPPRQMTRFSASMLQRTLAASDAEAATRHRTAEMLIGRLSGRYIPRPLPAGRAGYLRLPLLSNRLRAMSDTRAAVRLGIAAGYPVALRSLSQLQPHLAAVSACPGADHLASSIVTLPTHSLLTEPDVRDIVAWTSRATDAEALDPSSPILTP